ncbi:hypothetical protein F511_18495 [Dorcoceras hygrometricum]|uniref:Uncharacterized protein n=1 Tax=Dorcoceras hygrometricum TaxID=472368 RepID=A0A2Z7BC25_9LAMI|nr:hypothetical protein F511_18495 [Dorcoceras hygrometricum]
MSVRCFNAPELVKEDLLCDFRFSRKGVKLVEDLADRMGKTAMLKSLKGLQEKVEVSSRADASPSSRKGKRKVLPSGDKEARRQKKNRASTPEARPMVNPEALSVIESPIGPQLGAGYSGSRRLGGFCGKVCGGARAPHKAAEASRGAAGDKEQGEVGVRDREEGVGGLTGRYEGQADGEIGSIRSEVDRLKGEAEKACDLEKERDNGYSEEEHPASFLNIGQALVDMSEEGEATDGDAPGDDASTSPKDSPSPSCT